ncbi:hypothetical protein PG995_010999 [Apiospora arundinis]|uniref:Satratoxin biosynthesis SC1 cluster protein 4 n=1 Tax=Apiospora arundinis TaxID=335852 RepID=A0ABR2IVY4_9PEZI
MASAENEFVYSKINFDEPQPAVNRPEVIIGVVATFLVLAWLCCFFRLYIRLWIVRAAGLDDLFVVLNMVTITAGCIATCIAIKYGLGQHILQVEPWQVEGFQKSFYVMFATYACSAAFIKLALLFQYRRVFPRGSTMHKVVIGLIVFTSLWGIVYGLMSWIPCVPISDYWKTNAPDNHCYGFGAHHPKAFLATFESHTAVNMILDVTLLVIPAFLLWKEGGTRAGQLRLLALLMMGVCVIALAAWRLQSIIEHQAATWPTRDPTWYGPISIVLSALEVLSASICASIPIFWPMVTEGWGKIFVTQEVKVTRETRYFDDDDEDALTNNAHSRNGSNVSQVSKGANSKDKSSHYRDTYILRQVDPLHGLEERTHVTAAPSPEQERGKWTKL